MSNIDVNITQQSIDVTVSENDVLINVVDSPVYVNVNEQPITVEVSGVGPQGPAGEGVPTGGTTGQVLAKVSNTNYDTHWITAGAGSVTSVDMTVPTGLSISGNPITTSGTLALALSSGYVIPTQATIDGKVPYTGATGNVDLGEHEIKAGQFTLDTSPTGTAAVGTTRWNNTIGSTETTLKGGNVILKNGVDLVARVVNKVTPNATLTKAQYQAVRVTGAQGQRLAVAYAQANNDNNSADTIGIVIETIPTNQEGFIMTVGQLEGINTTGSLQGETWTDGDVLYLSPTTPGALTNVKPVAPQHIVVMGYVEYAHANNGKIYVKVMNGWELGELHDVNTAGATNGQVLTYNGSIWVPSTNASGTVTSVAATAGTGISVSGSPITTSGTLTITNTAPDQIVSLTGAGTTSISGTYPSFTITSNDQYTGTVTSVNLAVPTGFSLSGNPITTSGTITIGFASGYSLPTTAKQTEWDTAYTNRITSLTTTGSSGAATLISNTLNIPNYTLSGLGGVPSSRTLTINGTGYDLSVDRSWSVGTITALTGEATASGTGSVSITLDNASVIGKVLTGLNLTGGGTISATDTILQAFGKVQNQISALVGSVQYEGVWNASTNSPTILGGTGNKGDYYVVNVAGSTNIDGITDWKIGDWIIFNGTTWDKVDNTDAVSSVNGFTGAVSLSTSNISEGINLYFTNTRAQNAITLTTSGTSGSATYSSGTLNIPTYSLSGLGGVPTSRQLTINGTAYDLSADRSWSVGTVTSVGLTSSTTGVTIGSSPITSSGSITIDIATASSSANGLLSSTDWSTFNSKQAALNGTGFVKISGTTISYDNSTYYLASNPNSYIALTALSASAPLSYNSGTGAFSISQASGTTNGFLSSTDWTTFNNKQNALTNPVTGTGTTNYLPKFTGTSAIGNSQIFDNGTFVGVGTNSVEAGYLFGVNGDIKAANIKLTSLTSNGIVTAGGGVLGTISFADDRIAYWNSNTLTADVNFKWNGRLLINSPTDDTTTAVQINGNIKASAATFTGNLTVDTDNLFVDSVNNRVGIGTASPWAGLSLPFNNSIALGNSTYSYSITRSSAGDLITTFSDSYNDNAARVDFKMKAGAVNALSITGAGNIGIGTNAPLSTLHVNGDIRTSAPSGGTAKPWKLGTASSQAAQTMNTKIEVEVDGVLYYIMAYVV